MYFAVINGGDALEELIQLQKKIIGFVGSFVLLLREKQKRNLRGGYILVCSSAFLVLLSVSSFPLHKSRLPQPARLLTRLLY